MFKTMNKVKLIYSVLQYIPNVIRKEAIDVGVVVHVPSQEYSEFFNTNNTKRIYSFDDELNKNYLNMIFSSMKFKFNSDSIDFHSEDDRFDKIRYTSYLYDKTKSYVNEFRFLRPEIIESDNISEDIQDIKMTYLYYDYPKNNRISNRKMESLVKKQLKKTRYSNSEISLNIFKKKKLFTAQTDNFYIKPISFDYKNIGDLYNNLIKFILEISQEEVKKQMQDKTILIIINNNNYESNYDLDNVQSEFYKQLSNKIMNKTIIISLDDYAHMVNKGDL